MLSKMTQSDQIFFVKDYHTRFHPLAYAKGILRRSTSKNAHITHCVAFTMFFNRSRAASASLLMVQAHPYLMPYLLQRKPLELSSPTIYTERNRSSLRQWLDNTTSALDWSVYLVSILSLRCRRVRGEDGK